VLLGNGAQIESAFPLNFDSLFVEVRNSFDPWLAGYEVTEQTFNFGMTVKELRFLGIGLIFCCGGLLIQPIFWIIKNFCDCGERVDPIDKMVSELQEETEDRKIEDVDIELGKSSKQNESIIDKSRNLGNKIFKRRKNPEDQYQSYADMEGVRPPTSLND